MKSVQLKKIAVAVFASTTFVMPFVAAADQMPSQSGAAALQAAVFNFGWAVKGDRSVAPTQVFDDGSKVYMLFSDPHRIPVILANTAGGQILLGLDTSKPPYVIINHFESSLEFRSNAGSAGANRTRGARREEAVSTGAAAPILVTGAADAPVSMEELTSRRRTEDMQAGGTPYVPNFTTQQPAGAAAPGSAIAGQDIQVSSLTEPAIPKAVREFGTDRVQVLFSGHPASAVFVGEGGVQLWPEWDASGCVATVRAQSQMVIRQGSSSYEITRTTSADFQFDLPGRIGLVDAFERDGATYLTFRRAPKHLRITADGVPVHFTQRGRYFRVETVAPELEVKASGRTTTVSRTQHSQFSGRPVV